MNKIPYNQDLTDEEMIYLFKKQATGQSEEIMLLKSILKVAAELLPAHATDCGVHSAHPSYGNHYCNCKLMELKLQARKML